MITNPKMLIQLIKKIIEITLVAIPFNLMGVIWQNNFVTSA